MRVRTIEKRGSPLAGLRLVSGRSTFGSEPEVNGLRIVFLPEGSLQDPETNPRFNKYSKGLVMTTELQEERGASH